MLQTLELLSDRLRLRLDAQDRRIVCYVDVLGDVLDLVRIRGALMATLDAPDTWGLALPARDGASFHAVIAGSCWFAVEGHASRQLHPGDLVLIPGGTAHWLASALEAPRVRFDEDLKRSLIGADGELVLPGSGSRTRILCAGYSYDNQATHPLLGLLPESLHVATNQPEHGPHLRAVLDLLAHEARGSAETGNSTAAVRLLDVLLVHVIRAWLRQNATATPTLEQASWLRALSDPLTAKVLAVMHEQPAYPWTLERLAQAGHTSRSTLTRRFSEHVGEPPLSYLTRWRMEIAARRLRESSASAAAVAREVGYTSEYAFNRAFTRHRGQPPGRYRSQHGTPGSLHHVDPT